MTQKQRQSAGRSGSRQDALTLLTQDHDKVKNLFEEFEMLETGMDTENDKLDLVQEICTELTIHAQIEEEIFYPAAIEAIGQSDIMDEAAIEHEKIKDMVEQLMTMAPEEEYFDAQVTVLEEMVEHHVEEEEGKMFPKLKKAAIDLTALGERLSQRKQELQTDMGLIGASMRGEGLGGRRMPQGQGPLH